MTAAGNQLGSLCKSPAAMQVLFAELLCFTSGLFFGGADNEMHATMASMRHLLELEPEPRHGDDAAQDEQLQGAALSLNANPVGWRHASESKKKTTKMATTSRRFPRDPLRLLRALLKILRSSDSIDASDMGTLVLQHSWPKLRYGDIGYTAHAQ
eukprot:scpid1755/ scgid33362/ 